MKGHPRAILKNFIENDIFEQRHSAEKCKRGTLWDFLTSIVLQKIQANEGETLWCNPKNSKKSHIVPKKIRVKNTKGGSLVCFLGSGRRCFCFGRGSGISSMF